MLLATSQVFNHESEIGILLIVFLQLFIHCFGALLQINDLHLSWGNVLVQLFDFEVEDKLEFIQFLGTLFEVKDQFFFLRDD